MPEKLLSAVQAVVAWKLTLITTEVTDLSTQKYVPVLQIHACS